METAGLAIGVVGLFGQVFAGAIKAIKLIRSIKDAPKDFEQVLLGFRLQEGRLMSWGEGVGLLQAPAAGDEWRISISQQDRWVAQDLLDSVRSDIQQLLKPLITKAEEVDRLTAAQEPNERALNAWLREMERKQKELSSKITWATLRGDRLTSCLRCLTSTINDLISLTSEKTQREILRKVNLVYAELVLVHNSVDKLGQLFHALASAEKGVTLTRLAHFKAAMKERQAKLSLHPKSQLSKGAIEVLDLIEQDERWMARYDDRKGFWVEWKNYPTGNTSQGPTKEQIERFIIQELVGLLAEEDSHAIQVPQCIGYVDDHPRSDRFCLLYKYPKGVTTDARLQTLFSLFREPQRPDLADRIELARAVAQTLYYLHTVGWLHKAFRSDNILFFQEPNKGVEYSTPYVSGFDNARPSGQDQMSQVAGAKEGLEYYQHPDTLTGFDEEGRKPFRATFDVYSLGIILIEIAHWKPLREILRGSAVRPWEVHDALFRDPRWLQDVGFAVGRAYEDVVRTCLQGWNSLGADGVEETSTEGALCLMTNFEMMVLEKLHNIQVSG
ncbi:prion-inhibition and propagation-domain-containing protein [Aspergillus pseudonomiae]|uniref:Prion-inhibition and propagation-domain-containing protein n=1 Tax=Aspergillus pseudonomiae TaxID=1506151 RepID=A0A5N7DWA9_9EURO|nr:prion-inhibition and propagation-domain-containing protein [Aspergillus pseudonomiae]KAE8409798.1 prion-inhibition and propagation-domain-containing protein [Aspergillus pseudonomiae]